MFVIKRDGHKEPIMFDKIARNGELGLSEAYMDGDWDTSDLQYIISIGAHGAHKF